MRGSWTYCRIHKQMAAIYPRVMITHFTPIAALIAAALLTPVAFAGPMGLDVNAPLQSVDTKTCTTEQRAFIKVTCPPSALGIDRSDIVRVQIDMPVSGEQIACSIHVDSVGRSEFDLSEEIASIYGAPVRERHWINETSINQVLELSLEQTAEGLHLDYITERMPDCVRAASIF